MKNELLTPARQQYLDIKAQYPHALLWFRLGDFYEMFDDDARTAAAALRITLTSRSFGKDCRVPMCGVPHHAQARFLARLVRAGHSVAICEQVSPAGRGLVEREVVRVVTPGTISEPEILRAAENNYLAAIARRGIEYALAYVDVSTGEFRVTETAEPAALLGELERLQVAECLIEDPELLPGTQVGHLTRGEPALWERATATERLRRHLGARALHISGCEGRPAATAVAGAILGYLERTNRALLNVLHSLRPYGIDDTVAIDATTRTMLLGRHERGGERHASVHGLLDLTATHMGARQLAAWLRRPLRRLDILHERQDAVAALLGNGAWREALRAALKVIGDLERLTARIGQERASPEELLALASTLERIPAVVAALGTPEATLLVRAREAIDPALDIAAGVRAAVAEPGSTARIRPGYDPEIDRLAVEVDEARGKLAALEATERERTGIRSLKVSFNSVFGYYIEISKPNLSKAPTGYMRKQTLAHAERFVTPELLSWEATLSAAEERLQQLDAARYLDLQRRITADAARLLATAEAIATLDVAAALAEAAHLHGFCRPALVDDTRLEIRGGRHPLVEAAVGPGHFIPNDCGLGGDAPSLAIVTGPNMGGKSTYLRQVALIVYLAQIGSFVPAAKATIGLADRIFARVGAHDDLAAGHSTFLVEMAETAAIVRLATPRSLVLLDEIGRGTTSADGLAIARAVAEHLHEVVGARTLFATHYYELARASEGWAGSQNLHVRADEVDQSVVFLYRVEPGMADKSFALHVARMAGMPEPITLRAADLLAAAVTGAAAPTRDEAGTPAPTGTDAAGSSEAGPGAGWDGADRPAQDAAAPAAAQAASMAADRRIEDAAPLEAGAGTHADPPTAPPAEIIELQPEAPAPRAALRLAEAPLPQGAHELLEELLQFDLASMTPLEALNGLHELQRRARRLGQARGSRGPRGHLA